MGRRVLVLDDDPDILRLEQRILLHAGYEVIASLDGDRALAGIDHEPPDLILINLTMLRRHVPALRANMRGGAPPALLISNSDDAGPPGLPYLRRPFAAAELVHAVTQALEAA